MLRRAVLLALLGLAVLAPAATAAPRLSIVSFTPAWPRVFFCEGSAWQCDSDNPVLVLDLAADQPDLLDPVGGAERYLRVEIVHAAQAEAALHLEDVLVRRTRISMEYQHGGVDCAREVADLMAGLLGWDPDRVAREVELFERRIVAERASQVVESDDEADNFLKGVPEVREFLVDAAFDPASAEPVVEHSAGPGV